MIDRLEHIRDRIEACASKCGRNTETIRLVAVSKTIPAAKVEEAIHAGVNVFGENYVQEARAKFEALNSYDLSWHFIGHLQSNKAKYAVRIFDLIHSVDSLKLARTLNKEAGKVEKVQHILLQVNNSGEASKSGISPDGVGGLLDQIGQMDHLHVSGLMTMPPFFDDPERARPYFRALRQLRDQLAQTHSSLPNVALGELSMGMTGDFEAAIQEGATLVRIGTALFGRRQ